MLSSEFIEELREKSIMFADKFGSRALFKIFMEIAKGENYVTRIAKKVKRSKAIVSRQVKELANVRLIKVEGEGVKQICYPNWEVFTFYWIDTFAPAVAIAGDIFNMTENILEEAKVPKWMGGLYLSKEEWKVIERRKVSPEAIIEKKLIPVIPNLAPIVEILVKAGGSEDFSDSFRLISTSFALGLPSLEEMGIKFDEIENGEIRGLLEALYSKPVQLWLKILAFHDIYGANMVRNIVLDKIGLLKKK